MSLFASFHLCIFSVGRTPVSLHLLMYCVIHVSVDSSHASGSQDGGKGIRLDRVILICVLVSTVFTLGLVASYMFLRKRKREHGKAGSRKAF